VRSLYLSRLNRAGSHSTRAVTARRAEEDTGGRNERTRRDISRDDGRDLERARLEREREAT
jgi:hypothetical protein